jgi:3'-phosphoadenosine 5'-phosphosulfate (PAPS) 3'-phosphatase
VIDHAQLRAIMAQAGEIAMACWPGQSGADKSLDVWEKSPNNPVCSADLAVDAFLRERRRAAALGRMALGGNRRSPQRQGAA